MLGLGGLGLGELGSPLDDGASNLNPDPWLLDPAPLKTDATAVGVYRITGSAGSLTYQALPNVEVVSVQQQAGPDPHSAVFRYDLDANLDGAPEDVTEALNTAFTGDLVVNPGDRIGVLVERPSDGQLFWWFDGSALFFGGDLGPGMAAGFHGTGRGKRLWDTPVPGALWRSSSDPENASVPDVPTDMIAQFNPLGNGNASPSTGDRDAMTDFAYPVWLDPNLTTANDTDGIAYPRMWTLPMAVANLLYRNNDQTFVANPRRSSLDGLLFAREPLDGPGPPFDPANPATFTQVDIHAADVPLNNKGLAPLVQELIGPHNFDVRFDLSTRTNGEPQTTFSCYLKQGAAAKFLYLQDGDQLDLGASNCPESEMVRDLKGTANVVTIEGGLIQYEASFVLAPAFPMAAGDAANLDAYSTSDAAFATTAAYNAYRTFIFDEDASGHYANGTALKLTFAPNLEDLFGAAVDGVDQYVPRRRKPIGKLHTLDDLKRPLSYRLSISTDYTGFYPHLWDGTGHWHHINEAATLLPDRIGVRIGIDNPNKWEIGKSTVGTDPFKPGIVKVVQSLAAPDTENPAFFLRLTCVVEGDHVLTCRAGRTANSPLPYDVEQRVDARDRLHKKIVAANSELNVGGDAITRVDDGPDGVAEAISARQASEAGVFHAQVRLGHLTDYYHVGDRIAGLAGVGVSFRTDSGGTSQTPVYPLVVSRQWDFLAQTTQLELSDEGLSRRDRKRLMRTRGPGKYIPDDPGAVSGGDGISPDPKKRSRVPDWGSAITGSSIHTFSPESEISDRAAGHRARVTDAERGGPARPGGMGMAF